MDGIAGAMKLINLRRNQMENEDYAKVNSEEIIIKLKEILEFLRRWADKNEKELTNTPILGD